MIGIIGMLAGTLVSGAVKYTLEERKRIHEEELVREAMQRDLLLMVGKAGIMVLGEYLQARQERRNNQYQISEKSEQ